MRMGQRTIAFASGGASRYARKAVHVWTARWDQEADAEFSGGSNAVMCPVSRSIDMTGINAIDGNGLLLWLLHENEAVKQQVPKLHSSAAEEMDRGYATLLAADAT